MAVTHHHVLGGDVSASALPGPVQHGKTFEGALVLSTEAIENRPAW